MPDSVISYTKFIDITKSECINSLNILYIYLIIVCLKIVPGNKKRQKLKKTVCIFTYYLEYIVFLACFNSKFSQHNKFLELVNLQIEKFLYGQSTFYTKTEKPNKLSPSKSKFLSVR